MQPLVCVGPSETSPWHYSELYMTRWQIKIPYTLITRLRNGTQLARQGYCGARMVL